MTVTNHGFAHKKGKLQSVLVKVRFSIFGRQQPTSSWCHITMNWNFHKRMSSFEKEKSSSTLSFEHEGDQILKVLLWNILLFNNRVVQPSSMAYVKCVRKKVKLCGLWVFLPPPQFQWKIYKLLINWKELWNAMKWIFSKAKSSKIW